MMVLLLRHSRGCGGSSVGFLVVRHCQDQECFLVNFLEAAESTERERER